MLQKIAEKVSQHVGSKGSRDSSDKARGRGRCRIVGRCRAQLLGSREANDSAKGVAKHDDAVVIAVVSRILRWLGVMSVNCRLQLQDPKILS
jgi:hypothetical protein